MEIGKNKKRYAYRYETKYGMKAGARWFPLYFALIVLGLLQFERIVQGLVRMGMIDGKSGAIDVVIFLLKGEWELIPGMEQMFQLPILWILMMLYPCFVMGKILAEELWASYHGVLMRMGSRVRWWNAKCIQTIQQATLFFLSIWGITFLFRMFMGKVRWSSVSEVSTLVNEMDFSQVSFSSQFLLVFAIPCLTFCALAMLQLLIGIIVGPFYSVLVSILLFVLVSYFKNPFLIGSGGMMLRNWEFFQEGRGLGIGCFMNFTVIIISFFIGKYYIQRKDLIGKESK